jgi:hypothetical protein
MPDLYHIVVAVFLGASLSALAQAAIGERKVLPLMESCWDSLGIRRTTFNEERRLVI